MTEDIDRFSGRLRLLVDAIEGLGPVAPAAAYAALYNARLAATKRLQERGYRYGDDIQSMRHEFGIDMPLRWEGDDS